jgi:N-acetylated-alpha-linked acidic dipeptidase
MAGTEGDWNTAQYVAQHFTKYGLDTEFDAFKALVSYPVESQLKLVYPVEYTAGLAEDVLDEDYTSDTWFRNHAFNGYAPSGNVTAELVYVNYGRLEDFEYLVKDLGLDLKGKIALARYGKNYRGIKVKNAQNFGMIGCVLYSDPYDDGFVQGKTYPDGPWRPKSAIQRGSVDSGSVCVGDPGFLERDPDICGPVGHETLPKIPVLPISYKDAKHFLAQLKNSKAPKSWIGGLDVQYNVGPGPAIVSLYSNNSFEHKTLWNVIGKIKGQEYPDEYILLGNHRDAWVFGAVDPNSGTACMLDLVRSLSDLLKTGWKPKRTIIFCSWDGEEYDLIGSTHFGENRSRELTEKAVVYLNVDSSVSGRNLSISSSSSLKTFIFDSVKQVSSPENVSLFELWDKTVGTLGSGSDYTVSDLDNLVDLTCFVFLGIS